MRDIKFRAWSKEQKEMINVLAIHFKDNLLRAEDIRQDEWKEVSLNDSILMQYTGLKDKNGKEIYEGDMLREIPELSPKDYQKRTGQLVYEPNVAAFMVFTEGGYCHLNGGKWDKDCLDYTEVIGNIYENPELLEKELSE